MMADEVSEVSAPVGSTAEEAPAVAPELVVHPADEQALVEMTEWCASVGAALIGGGDAKASEPTP